MNAKDENAQEIAEDAVEEVAGTEAAADKTVESPPPKTPESTAVVTLFFFVGFILSLAVGWGVFPKLLYSQKEQPIQFNHALHNQMVDEGCESCHFFREDGTFSGVPKIAQCIDCHEDVNGEDPDEEKFVYDYVAKGREVPWLVYSQQPDCVFFSHVAHVKMGNMQCVTCHGHIGESTHLKTYQENRITGYSRDIWGENISGIKRNSWDRMKMDDCAQCHDNTADKSEAVHDLPWPLNWMPKPWEPTGGKKTSVQTKRDACFVCHK